jgi:uncharacterized repeat protein (TIGR01451 family)
MPIALLAAVPFDSAFAQVAPSLGTAGSFSVLGGQTVTNTGPTILNGDLGVFPGSAITGFPPGIVIGTTHAGDTVAQSAQADTTTAYNSLASQPCTTTFGVPTDLAGMTLVPGVYCFASSASLSGTLTLDGQGNPNAVFIFKTGSTLITGSNASVVLINGAQPCNVFWQVGSSATIGTGTNFAGNILALTSITLTTNATLAGRALAQNGSVTLDSNVVTATTCAAASVSLSKAFTPATIAAGGTSTLTLTLSNTGGASADLTAPLTDNLPTGVVVAATPNATTTCGGAVTTSTSSVTLTGGAIPANGACTVSVNVSAAAGGAYINTVPAGSLQTTNGSNTGPATATLTVTPVATSSVTLGKAFSPASITRGGFSTLTITLSNTGVLPAIMTAPLVDTLPSGVVVGSPANTATTCGGSVAAPSGGSTVTLTGGIIPSSGSCTVTVRVTANAAGYFTNTLQAGALQTTNGSNAAPAVATLTVTVKQVPPTVKKSFSPSTIKEGQVSVLTITLTNPSNMAATLTAPLVDQLPSGLQITGYGASTTCRDTVTAPNGGSTVTLKGGTIPAKGSCTVTAKVTSYHKGTYVNKLKSGALRTCNGSNQYEATATLVVTKSK